MGCIMDLDAQQMARLKELGLPTYAIRAYLALLQLGEGEARQVSEIARIPPAKVYGTLEQIQQKGLAEVVPGRPRKYVPVPMVEFLERQIEEQQDHLAALVARKDELAELFPILGTAEVGDRACISMVSGRRNISEHFREHTVNAKHEMILILPANAERRLRALARLVADARSRGVRVRVLAHDGETLGLDENEVRMHPAPALASDVAIATFDGHSALLAHFAPGEPTRASPKDVALLVREGALVQVIADLAHLRWLNAGGAAATTSADTPLEKSLPSLLRTSTEAIVITDESDRVALWSQGAEAILGVRAAEATGQPLRVVAPALADAARSRSPSVTLTTANKERATYMLSFTRAPMGRGGDLRLLHLSAPGLPRLHDFSGPAKATWLSG